MIECLTLKGGVFPTPVGVFLVTGVMFSVSMGLPHARGGVSPAVKVSVKTLASSPRPWGCFK